MTDLAPPKCRIEIFSKPAFFTDHFLKDTNLTYATATYDGDQVQVNVDAGDPFGQGQLYCDMPGDHINTNPKRYLVVRVAEFTPVSPGDHYWLGVIKLGSGSVGEQFTTIGLKILDLKTLNSGVDFDFTAFCLDFIGDHSTVTLDYVAIVEGTTLIPFPIEDDLAEKLNIKTPLLNSAVKGASFLVPNFAGAYNGLITEHDVVLIWLSRDSDDLGDPAYKRFGGRVVSTANRTRKYGDHFIEVECHGHAAELLAPPVLLQETYAAVNGRTIVEAAVALAAYVVKHPTATEWFDNAGSSGSTDDRISSTHDVTYDEKKLMTVIQEIIENAKNPAGVQGFDVYETPSGCLAGHLRNSLDFVSPIDPLLPESYVYKRDIHPIRNKQKVYGAALKTYPAGIDDWCEATTGWTLDYGTLATSSDKILGTYSLRLTNSAGGPTVYTAHITRTFSAIKCEPAFNESFKALRFSFKSDLALAGFNPWIAILAPDTSNYFYRDIPVSADWKEVIFKLGTDEWTSYGSPDWKNVQGITIYCQDNTNTTGIWFDALHFEQARFSGEDEDSTSQGLYGVRCAEPIVDEALMTDAECLARAESLVKQLKDTIKSLSNVVTDGNEGLWPGQRQHVHGVNDGIDETFRIIEVEDKVQGGQWDAILTLDNEPQLIDAAFLLIAERTKRLEHKP